MHNNKLYVANAGDCKGVLISVNGSGEATHKKITQTFNANSKKEQARLKQSFQDEDIFTCKESGACYVKVQFQIWNLNKSSYPHREDLCQHELSVILHLNMRSLTILRTWIVA